MNRALVVAVLFSLLGLAAPAAASADTSARGGAAAPYPVTSFRAEAADDDRLKRAWATWQARGDHRRYATVVQQYCFCPPRRPVVTRVQGRTVTSVARQGRTVQMKRRGYEVPRLYALLRDAYRTADEVQVRYRRGVPVRILVDHDERLSDDELVLEVSVSTPSRGRPTAPRP